ncbi:MAG: hypothetical protein P4L27_13360 [Ignavibacteriaceae bacterium]|nr:hypothetical protein [Ignavibacteriaceae bacterium]
MHRVYLVFISLLIIFNNLFPQVKIKEKVDIKPPEKLQTASSLTHSLRFEVNWSNLDYGGGLGVYMGDSRWGTGVNYTGYAALELTNALAGGYLFQPGFFLPAYYPSTCTMEYKIYLDGTPVYDYSGSETTNYWGETWFTNIDFGTPYYNGISVQIESGCVFKTVQLFPDYSRSSQNWDPNTDSVKISIISGGEYVSFYDRNSGQVLGDTINNYYCSKSSIGLVYEEPVLGTTAADIIIKAEVNGVTQTQSISLDPITHFTLGGFNYAFEQNVSRGGQRQIWFHTTDENGCSLPDGFIFNASIVSADGVGELINPLTNEIGRELNNLHPQYGTGTLEFIYRATYSDQINQDSALIRITSPLVPDTYYFMMHIGPFPFVVTIDPPILKERDTANIIIKQRHPDGSISDFDPDQIFEVGILDGCVNGKLFVKAPNDNWDFVDSSGTYFEWAEAPIKFIAADNIDTTSNAVKIVIGCDAVAKDKVSNKNKKVSNSQVEQISNYIFGHMDKGLITPKNKELILEQIRKNENYGRPTVNNICYVGKIWSNYKKEVIIDHYSIKLISPDSVNQRITTDPTTHLPKMPVISCRAELKNLSGGTPIDPALINWKWVYQVSYKYHRRDMHTNMGGEWIPDGGKHICPRYDTLEFYGESNPWIVPFSSSGIKRIKIRGTKPERLKVYNHDPKKYGGDCTDIVDDYKVNKEYSDTTYFTGGNVKIIVTAEYRDKNNNLTKLSEIFYRMSIIGKNPEKSDYNYVYRNNKDFGAIINHESGRHQFTIINNGCYPYGTNKENEGDLLEGEKLPANNPFIDYPQGFPNYGGPNGYGFCQIDSWPKEIDLWNWRENLRTGEEIFKDKKIMARKFFSDHNIYNVNESSEQFLKTAYNYYNGPFDYYKEVAKGVLEPVKEEGKKCKTYGYLVYKEYLKLIYGGN